MELIQGKKKKKKKRTWSVEKKKMFEKKLELKRIEVSQQTAKR